MNEQPLNWKDVFALWDELRDMARRLLSREGRAQSVQPSELVLTALRRQKPGGWKRGFDVQRVTWEKRKQFFAQMHRAMWQKLIELAREEARVRQIKIVRIDRLDLENLRRQVEKQPEIVEALKQALEKVKDEHPEWVALIECLFWDGLTQKEAAEWLNVSEKTAHRWFRHARAWLYSEINRILASSAE